MHEPDEEKPTRVMTVAKLMEVMSKLPPDLLVVVGNETGLDHPLAQTMHVRIGGDGLPLHLCTADTPDAVQIFLL